MDTPDTLRALSIRQPWAGCIASGRKTVENRTWGTSYRGALAIHASARADAAALADRRAVNLIHEASGLPDRYWSGGAVLATARIADVHPYRPGCCASQWAEDYAGLWHWVLADIHRLAAPIPAKGRLGLWEPAEGLAEQITAQLRAASS